MKVTLPDGYTTEIIRDVELNLHDINDFYDHWQVPYTDAQRTSINTQDFDDAILQSASCVSSQRFFDAAEYTMYVHGSNNSDVEKEVSAQTMYKRLYWQGYSGRFGVFKWPTYYVDMSAITPDAIQIMQRYDASELQAWRSGKSLKDTLQSLDYELGTDASHHIGANVNLLAHSMGNIAAGEALRQWARVSSAPLVKTYFAMQAAVSAGAYGDNSQDAGPRRYGCDLYRYFPTGTSQGGTAFFDGIHSAASNWINMYNPQDYALSCWEWQNWQKPMETMTPSSIWEWNYQTHRDIFGVDFYRGTNWEGFSLMTGIGTWDEPGWAAYEALAFCSAASSRPIGTKPVAEFENNIDIRDVGLTVGADLRPNHSFEFNHDAITTWGFYEVIKFVTDFESTY